MSYATGPEKSPLAAVAEAAAGCNKTQTKSEEIRLAATLGSQLPGLGSRQEQLHLWQPSHICLACS